MFVGFHHPRAQVWQTRLSRMPRWGWIAVLIGVVLPLVVVGAVALASGLVVFLAVALVLGVLNAVRRLFHRPADDGRRNVRIVVHSARVIDP
jgi:hypothetical protein